MEECRHHGRRKLPLDNSSLKFNLVKHRHYGREKILQEQKEVQIRCSDGTAMFQDPRHLEDTNMEGTTHHHKVPIKGMLDHGNLRRIHGAQPAKSIPLGLWTDTVITVQFTMRQETAVLAHHHHQVRDQDRWTYEITLSDLQDIHAASSLLSSLIRTAASEILPMLSTRKLSWLDLDQSYRSKWYGRTLRDERLMWRAFYDWDAYNEDQYKAARRRRRGNWC